MIKSEQNALKIPLDPQVQWFLLQGTKPALPPEEFGKSRPLFEAVHRRMSLLNQFRGAACQTMFEGFAQDVKNKRIEASRVILPTIPKKELFVMAPKGHKQQAVDRLVEIIKRSPAAEALLNSQDLVAEWLKAETPFGKVIGGYDVKTSFMFAFNRPVVEDIKSLFGVRENPGHYKPRPERDPAFFSEAHLGMSVVRYPEQIEKARQQLMYYKQAGSIVQRQLYCLVDRDVLTNNPEDIDVLRRSGINVISPSDHQFPSLEGVKNYFSTLSQSVALGSSRFQPKKHELA